MPASQTPVDDRLEKALRSAAQRVVQRANELAECSDSEEGLTRLFCSPAMKAAHEMVGAWMASAEMRTCVDAAGNLIGRRGDDDRRKLLFGSHLDTVVNAGRYDGALGVLIGVALAEVQRDTGFETPFAIDVLGFSEEEGIRYQTPYIGSRAVAGDLKAGDPLLERLDPGGIRMADALASFGCECDELANAAYEANEVVAFLEPHIEQGPVLEQEDLPVGVVASIAGQTRALFRFVGVTGHAGTVPMGTRKDPLSTASRFVVAVEQIALTRAGTMATVGRLEVSPNVANVIPSEVAVRIDLRHADDTEREFAFVAIHRAAMKLAEERGVECQLEWVEQQSATPCDSECAEVLAESIAAEGYKPLRMTSGAGHDAVVMASRFPSALLFLRCRAGLSHHPDESASSSDIEVALRVLWQAVCRLAEREPQRTEKIADPA